MGNKTAHLTANLNRPPPPMLVAAILIQGFFDWNRGEFKPPQGICHQREPCAGASARGAPEAAQWQPRRSTDPRRGRYRNAEPHDCRQSDASSFVFA